MEDFPTQAKLRTASGNYQFEFQPCRIPCLSRWEGGDWLVVGEDTLRRGDSPGWRFSGGILVFGGTLDTGNDAAGAFHIDNDFTLQGGNRNRDSDIYLELEIIPIFMFYF